MNAAERIANARQARVAFALIDADGTLHQRGGRATFRTGSLLKPLLLATYLRRSDVRGFKGGWGSGSGQVNSQTARLTRASRLITLSVMTEANPSHGYGSETIRRIAAKLLRPQPCPPL